MPKRRNKPHAALEKVAGLRDAGPPWQVQTAKARFSEVFRRARTEGPQLITRQGRGRGDDFGCAENTNSWWAGSPAGPPRGALLGSRRLRVSDPSFWLLYKDDPP